MLNNSEREEWMKKTIEQSILASLQREIPYDDLLDEEWAEFKDVYQKGDELWYFRTPPHTWTGFPLCGMEGYALVRNDKLIAEILTSIS